MELRVWLSKCVRPAVAVHALIPALQRQSQIHHRDSEAGLVSLTSSRTVREGYIKTLSTTFTPA